MGKDAKSKNYEEKLKTMSKEELVNEAIKWHTVAKENYEVYNELKEKFKKLAARYCYFDDSLSDID